jgi:ribosomal protein S20
VKHEKPNHIRQRSRKEGNRSSKSHSRTEMKKIRPPSSTLNTGPTKETFEKVQRRTHITAAVTDRKKETREPEKEESEPPETETEVARQDDSSVPRRIL